MSSLNRFRVSASEGSPSTTQYDAQRSAPTRPEQVGGGANPNDPSAYTWRVHAQQRARMRVIQRIGLGVLVAFVLALAFASCAAVWPARAQSEGEQHKINLILIHAPARLTIIGDPCRDMTECVTQ